MTRRWRIIRNTVFGTLALCAGAVCVLTLTQTGRDGLANLAGNLASSPDRTVRISGLGGLWSGPLKVAQVLVADRDGPWLALDGIEADLSYAALLSRTIRADRLTVARIEVVRAPKAAATEEESASGEFSLPVDVDLPSIELPQIVLGPELAGEAATLSARSKLLAAASPLRIESDTAIARIDGRPGDLALKLTFAPGENRLDIDVSGAEPQGGVLANLLRLPGAPPVSVAIAGSGPASDWRGQGAIAVDEVVVAKLSGRHQLNEAGNRIEVNGEGAFSQFLPAGLHAIAEGQTRMDFTGTLAGDGGIDVEKASLQSSAFGASASGRIDPRGRSNFALRAAAAGAPVRLFYGEGDDAAALELRSIEANVSGSGRTPVVDASIGLASLTTPQGKLSDVGLDISSTAFDVATRTGPVDAQLSIGSVATRIAGLAPYLAGQISASIKANVGKDEIAIQSSSIQSDSVVASATGVLTRADGSAKIAFKGDVIRSALPEAARRVLDERLILSGNVVRTPDGAIALSGLDVSSGGLKVGGSASLADGSIMADLTGGLADLSGLAPGVGGAATFSLSAKGSMVAPDVTMTIGSERMESGGRAITDLALKATGTANAAAPSADVTLSGKVEGQPLTGSAKLSTKEGRRELSGINLALGDNRISGDLMLDDAFLPSGAIDLMLPDIGPLAALGAQQASGAAKGRIRFEHGRDGPTAEIDTTVQSFRSGDIAGRDIAIQAIIANYVAAPAISGRVRAAAIDAAGTAISNVDVKLTRDGVWTGFEGGATANAIPATAKGRAKYEKGTATVELDAGKATVQGIAASIAGKSVIVNSGGVTRLDGVALAIAGGRATVDGTVGAQMALEAKLAGIPASVANSFAPGLDAAGTVSGRVNVTGTPASPQVRYDVKLASGQTSQTRGAGFGAMTIGSTGTFADGTLRFDATVGEASGLTMKGGGTVATTGSKALNVEFAGAVPFGFLTQRLAAQGLALSGAANVSLSVGGTTSAPVIAGSVKANGARFIDARSGIAINDINADIGLGDGVAKLRSLTGTISTGGTVTASGTVGIDGGGFPADLAVKVASGRYTDGRIVTANFTGDIAIKGPLVDAPTLSGTINLGRTVITIPETLPGSLTKLNVKHKNASGKVAAQAEALKPATSGGSAGGLSLDLTVNAPQQIFVQGRGLDAELGGQIRLTGPVSAPSAVGEFKLRRGRLGILGRRLDFSRGSVGFSGSLIPMLDFAANSTVNSSTVTITVSGPATSPKFDFSSNPDAPEDEVMARLVFGRSLSSLSPIQIAQLASAAAQLAGVGGSTSLLDTLRGKLGVDDLDLKTDDAGDTSVSVGKYLNDRTYITIEKGSKPGSGKAAIDLSVGKGVKLRGEASDDGTTKGGIFFEKEY